MVTIARDARPFATPLRAILWAQLRVLRNLCSRTNRTATLAAGLVTVFWNSLWLALALFLAQTLADPTRRLNLAHLIPGGLLLVVAYWQLVPLILISNGMSLDLRRVAVYPISSNQMFRFEVLLRCTTSFEMLLVLGGAGIGLSLSSPWPNWIPVAIFLFVVWNLLMGVALKDLLSNLLARRGWRETIVLLFVSLAALPQYIGVFGMPSWMKALLEIKPSAGCPWTATADLILGQSPYRPLAILLGWLLCTYGLARRQFSRSLRFDRDEKRAAEETAPRSNIIEHFYRLPCHFFRNPLAALVEKELRFLSRAPRFRLVFLMGFSFGLIIWLPIAMGRLQPGGRAGFFANHFLTIICVYALTLLAEVSFWNHLGFDRAAAQLYFLAPIDYRLVVAAKNLAGLLFLLLELGAIFLVMLGLQLPLQLSHFLEAMAVTFVLCLFLAIMGNTSSTLYPRPIDPSQPWRSSSAGKVHALLVLLYPLASVPIGLAYLACNLLGGDWAFYGVLAIAGGAGVFMYRRTLTFATTHATNNRERIISLMSLAEGPVRG